MENCIFCDIVSGKEPCYKIYEDEFALAFLDIANDCSGHTLVIPKKHYVSVLDCEKSYLDAVMLVVQKVSNHYVKNCGFDGVNIMNASGDGSEQSVFHLHFHILPRKKNDGLHTFPKLPKNKQNLEKIANKLKMNDII